MNWESVKLTSICKPKQWKIISQSELKETGYVVYGANGKMGYYTEFNHKDPVLLIGCRGSCGMIHISEPFSYANGNAMACDDLSIKVDIKFLKYFLEIRGFDDIISGGVQKQITIKGLERIEIPLPPLPIQKRIAEILDAAETLKRKDQELLNKYDELAQAIFIDMFGDPVKNEKGWEVKKLGELFVSNPRLGTIKPASEDGVIPVVRVGELGSLNVNLESCKKVNLDKIEKERFLLKKDDIILARAIGSIDHLGKASLIQNVTKDLVFDSHVMRLQFDQKMILSYFFYSWLKTKGGRKIFLENSGKTAVQYNINGSQISQIKVFLPPINIQNEYLKLVQNLQNQIDIIATEKKTTDNLFQTLIQKAFKGELVS